MSRRRGRRSYRYEEEFPEEDDGRQIYVRRKKSSNIVGPAIGIGFLIVVVLAAVILFGGECGKDPFEAYRPAKRKYEKEKSVDERYKAKNAKLEDSDIAGHYELAVWCDTEVRAKLTGARKKIMYHLKMVLKNNPNHDGALKMAKSLYSELVRTQKPSTANEHYNAARFCMKMHYTIGAKKELNQALRIDPNHRDAKEMLRGLR